MRNFLRSIHRQLWRVEKWKRGKYHNSPKLWTGCGVIRAANREAAALKAMFHVGSSQVRVTPIDRGEL